MIINLVIVLFLHRTSRMMTIEGKRVEMQTKLFKISQAKLGETKHWLKKFLFLIFDTILIQHNSITISIFF
jgi:hypothetical protein